MWINGDRTYLPLKNLCANRHQVEKIEARLRQQWGKKIKIKINNNNSNNNNNNNNNNKIKRYKLKLKLTIKSKNKKVIK